jgi:molybdopterin/thiamine biosynthesis adenylyltransferase
VKTEPAAVGLEQRYARHELIPDWEQDRLAAATVVVIGVGALGNEVAKNLALAGLGRIVLCDPDRVQVSNLSRTVLFRPEDADASQGALKVEAAAAALRALVPGLVVEARPFDLASGVGLGELADAAAVFGCLDSRRARLRLLGRCALVEAPLVDGGTHPWGGEVRVRLSTEQPCYGCSLTARQRADSDLPWSCLTDEPDGPVGASIASSALVAAWMTVAGLRIVLGGAPDYALLRIDGRQGQTVPVELERDPLCPHHRPIGTPARIGVGAGRTVEELLAGLADGVSPDAEPLTWEAFRLPGSCANCGQFHETATDAGAASRLCSRCLRRLRLPFSHRIRDAAGSFSLRGLGVAPEEILAVPLPDGEIRWIRLSL